MALSTEALAARVQKAIKASGTTQDRLAKTINLNPTALSRALAGTRNFKPLELALIAETLGIPVQRLLADGEQDDIGEASIAARTQPDASPAVEEALARVQQMLELDELLCELGCKSPASLLSVPMVNGSPHEQGERLAMDLRTRLGIGIADLPVEISSLATDLEDRMGIDVAIEPLPRGLDGLAVARCNFQLIMVSSSIPATRQRYTIAHELGHLLAGDGGDIQVDENIMGGKTPAESRANAFAASFLMPAEALRAAHGGRSEVTQQFVADLLSRYRVSLDALAFRLHNVGILTVSQREDVRRMSSARISLRQGRAADLQARRERRWPSDLLCRAVEAYAKGKISIRPISKLLDIDENLLLEELSPPQLAASAPADDDELVPLL
jgi:Zn-dependent peptidase ImmA (M78 family)/transcriptional regulator with XRE-family HTH domain